jgi:hypothetical protein
MDGEDQVPSLGWKTSGENKQIVRNVMAVIERKNKEIHGLRDYWENDRVQNVCTVLLLIFSFISIWIKTMEKETVCNAVVQPVSTFVSKPM